jgi:hypothetical protein
VLHRDLKPENVLVDVSGAVKLTDFELGKTQGEASQLRLSLSFRSGGEVEGIGGTLAYMSPEQRAGKVPDGRSDIYTFGVLLFEALTGTLPEPGDRPSDFVHGLPPEVDQVFERCFARLERRFADAAELLREVEVIRARLGARVNLAQLVAQVPRKVTDGVLPQALERSTSARLRRENQVEALEKEVERASAESARLRAAEKEVEARDAESARQRAAALAAAPVAPAPVAPASVAVALPVAPANGDAPAGPVVLVRPPIEELMKAAAFDVAGVTPVVRAPIDEALAARVVAPVEPAPGEPTEDEPERPRRVAERS